MWQNLEDLREPSEAWSSQDDHGPASGLDPSKSIWGGAVGWQQGLSSTDYTRGKGLASINQLIIESNRMTFPMQPMPKAKKVVSPAQPMPETDRTGTSCQRSTKWPPKSQPSQRMIRLSHKLCPRQTWPSIYIESTLPQDSGEEALLPTHCHKEVALGHCNGVYTMFWYSWLEFPSDHAYLGW